MSKKLSSILGMILVVSLILVGCSQTDSKETGEKKKLNIVATTTMLADLASVIGQDQAKVDGLMGPGIDPHLYQASAGDVSLMQKADVVIFNGLHLEGKMGEIFEKLSEDTHKVIRIEDALDKSTLLTWEDGSAGYDPHIWFDAALWKVAARHVAQGLSQADPDHAKLYEERLKEYLAKLDETDAYIRQRSAEVPEGHRVLVTAHDAFSYFGKAYGFEVKGLQGISTDAEAGTGDVSALASFIEERKIKAIFVESSVPPKTIEALQAAVKAKGFDVAIGGELYSDSLGGKDSGAESYILMVKANIDTIVNALK